jgi:hypothetical protein
MIQIERLGFCVDPTALVAVVLPAIQRLSLVTGTELAVRSFQAVRHKMDPLCLVCEEQRDTEINFERLVTSTGYKVEAMFGADGSPWMATVRAPRYRRQPKPVETRCPACGMKYMKGDPDSGAEHRLEHRLRIRSLMPPPNPRAAAAIAVGWTGAVDASSPRWMQTEMYRRATAFKREFGYDFVQWHPNGEFGDDVRGVRFVDHSGAFGLGAIVGACCFRVRARHGPPCWELDWIWLAPPARRRGILTLAWDGLVQRFGQFDLCPPVSDAMQAFVRKAGHVPAAAGA